MRWSLALNSRLRMGQIFDFTKKIIGKAVVTTKIFLKISNKAVCLTSYQVEVVHNTRKLPPSFTFTTFGSTCLIEKAVAAPTRNRLEMSSFMLI